MSRSSSTGRTFVGSHHSIRRAVLTAAGDERTGVSPPLPLPPPRPNLTPICGKVEVEEPEEARRSPRTRMTRKRKTTRSATVTGSRPTRGPANAPDARARAPYAVTIPAPAARPDRGRPPRATPATSPAYRKRAQPLPAPRMAGMGNRRCAVLRPVCQDPHHSWLTCEL